MFACISVEENSKDIVKKAAQAVGSLSDTEFSITFNPDVLQSHVKHADPEVTITFNPDVLQSHVKHADKGGNSDL